MDRKVTTCPRGGCGGRLLAVLNFSRENMYASWGICQIYPGRKKIELVGVSLSHQFKISILNTARWIGGWLQTPQLVQACLPLILKTNSPDLYELYFLHL